MAIKCLCIYFLLQHGDLEPSNVANKSFVPCVTDIKNFASSFLFSVETQHTIGYGGRSGIDVLNKGLCKLIALQCNISSLCLTQSNILKIVLNSKLSLASLTLDPWLIGAAQYVACRIIQWFFKCRFLTRVSVFNSCVLETPVSQNFH